MADRIWVEKFNDDVNLVLIASGEEETADTVINVAQAKQLVIDLNKLIAGETPSEDAEVEGVED